MIRKIFKYIIYFLLALMGIVLFTYLILDERKPVGEQGEKAERLTDAMLLELNKDAWDSLEIVSWTFPPGHNYEWHKHKDSVIIKWSDYRVHFLTKSGSGQVFEKDIQLIGEDKEEKLRKARDYFFNDSFWLIAPFKVKDPGTIREYVNYEGKDALLVTYTTGGATPGDSYLWILDEKNRPISWKMWVSIIPFGGMETSWESWEKFHGAWISTLHKGPIDIKIENLSAEK